MAKKYRPVFNPDVDHWNMEEGRPMRPGDERLKSRGNGVLLMPNPLFQPQVQPEPSMLPPSMDSGPADIRGADPVSVKIPPLSSPPKAKKGKAKGAPQTVASSPESGFSADAFQSKIDPGLMGPPQLQTQHMDISGARSFFDRLNQPVGPGPNMINPGSIKSTAEVPEDNFSLAPSEHFKPFNAMGEGEKQRQGIYHNMIFSLLTSGLGRMTGDAMREASVEANAVPPPRYPASNPRPRMDQTHILQQSPVPLGPQAPETTQVLPHMQPRPTTTEVQPVGRGAAQSFYSPPAQQVQPPPFGGRQPRQIPFDSQGNRILPVKDQWTRPQAEAMVDPIWESRGGHRGDIYDLSIPPGHEDLTFVPQGGFSPPPPPPPPPQNPYFNRPDFINGDLGVSPPYLAGHNSNPGVIGGNGGVSNTPPFSSGNMSAVANQPPLFQRPTIQPDSGMTDLVAGGTQPFTIPAKGAGMGVQEVVDMQVDPSLWNFLGDRKRLMAILATVGLGSGAGVGLGMSAAEAMDQPPEQPQKSQPYGVPLPRAIQR